MDDDRMGEPDWRAVEDHEVEVAEGVTIALEGETGAVVWFASGDMVGGAALIVPELPDEEVDRLVETKIGALESEEPMTDATLDVLSVLYEWKRRRDKAAR